MRAEYRADFLDDAQPTSTIEFDDFGSVAGRYQQRSVWLHRKSCPLAAQPDVATGRVGCRCGDFDTLLLHVPLQAAIGHDELLAIQAQLGRNAVARQWHGGLSRRNERYAKARLSDPSAAPQLIGEIAQHCKLSRSHFSKAFKQSTGLSPYAWQLQQRLQRARQLLNEDELSIAVIADRCGFADQSHLTRQFKLHFGSTPALWRRLQQR